LFLSHWKFIFIVNAGILTLELSRVKDFQHGAVIHFAVESDGVAGRVDPLPVSAVIRLPDSDFAKRADSNVRRNVGTPLRPADREDDSLSTRTESPPPTRRRSRIVKLQVHAGSKLPVLTA
jgi:hypothetical protein